MTLCLLLLHLTGAPGFTAAVSALPLSQSIPLPSNEEEPKHTENSALNYPVKYFNPLNECQILS